MLYEATISRSTLELLISLMNDEFMKDFVLVGDTSLALQLGHRISVDLDLFSNIPFNIAFLSGKITFGKMLEAYISKYGSNPVIPLKAITYFEDINFNEPIKMTGKGTFNWMKIEKRLKSMQQFPKRLFPPLL